MKEPHSKPHNTKFNIETNPKELFFAAAGFDYASIKLKEKISLVVSLDTPFLVNEIFAIELYIKCIVAIENNNFFRSGHELTSLFSDLSSEAQENVEKYFYAYVYKLKQFRGYTINGVHLTLNKALEINNKSFQELRYYFEKKDSNNHISAIATAEIKRALCHYIITIRPEWNKEFQSKINK
ncbi:hypothetical protein [Flavobacterium sp. C4GT6]|uniref:hypothetical protein n=1 Tax=Flavobacterium sp. C4GT6 TaxID=3103818 RepID=UPI002ED238A2